MSQKPSACIPPPPDYTPRARLPHATKFRERGGKSGHNRSGDHHHRRQFQQTTFQRNQPEPEERPKNQLKDRFYRNEDDDYFADVHDDEEEDQDEKAKEQEATVDQDDDDEDPLDAYMKSLEGDNNGDKHDCKSSPHDNSPQNEVSNSLLKSQSSTTTQENDKRGVRLDIDETDDIEESYYQYVEQKMGQTGEIDELDDRQSLVEYDKDGNIISVGKLKREIEPLPSIDHSTIKYESFHKIFYQEHDEIQKLTQEQGEELRSKLEIKVSGDSPPKPVCSFAHFKFDEKLMRVIRRSEYTQPTPIQAQAIPAALLGRNVIGIAVTGSGKTAAYLWPMIVHIMGQPDLKRGDGPIGLVLVPTRELALQVYSEAKKFSNSYKIAVVCAYGGGSKYEQSKDLEAGAEIVVATPGRIIDLIKMGVTNLQRVTYLVLDEADRFFEMGFEAQVRSICDHIRPDRQTLLFSATFKHKIEQLARTVTENPVKIVQKSLGEANEDVTQHVTVLSAPSKKWDWLTSRLVEFTSAGSVLIFVTRIVNSEELHKNLMEYGTETLLLHGDMEQSERNRVITSFKRKEKDIMIATDVAARGLDISHIKTVINYEVARDIDTHIHRVGRTGRAGSKGDAHTLLTDKDKEFAGHLVKNLESSNQNVGEDLMKLAMQSHTFRKSHGHKHHKQASSSSSGSRGHQHHYNQNRPKSSHHNESNRFHHYDSRDSGAYQRSSHSHRGSNHYKDRERSPHRGSSKRDSGRSSYHDDRKRPRWH